LRGAPSFAVRWRRLSLRHWLLALVALLAAAAAIASYATGALAALERDTVDTRFDIRGNHPADHGIVIVGLDTRSLGALNLRPPIPRHFYAQLLDRLHASGPRSVGMDVQFIGQTNSADDRALVAAVVRDGPIVLSTHDGDNGPIPVPAGLRGAPGAIPASAAVDTDPDGVVRRMLYAPVQLPTFAVVAAGLILGHPVSQSNFPGNDAWIDFRGPPGTFPTYSLIDVLNGRVPASTFAGKTVLVGITDPAQKDVFTTAVSSVPMAGVEVQANALATILSGFPLGQIPGWLEIVVVFLLAAIPAVLAVRLAALYVLAAVVVVLGLFLVICQLLFDSGSIVSLPDPILALLISLVGSIAVDAFVQRQQLRRLQKAFDLLPSPVSDFFISYRRNQSAFVAGTLRQELARRFGESSVFMDRTAISAGQEWPNRIQEAVAACRAMLVLIGPGWVEARNAEGQRRLDEPGDWVRQEIEEGLRHERVAVVPVLHDGAPAPGEDDLPDSLKPLARRHAVSLTGDDVATEIDELVGSIEHGQLREFLKPAGPGEEAAPQSLL
jgi:CHASE2 domain-containing sensor protein